ncbi:MAG: hypothetical protein AABX39_06185 [Nanoarchaeota archaeon]
MELNIASEKKQSLLGRKLVSGTLKFDKATPSYAEVKKDLAGKTKSSEEVIILKNIYTDFGARTATFEAVVYDSPEALKSIELEKKKKDGAATPPAEEVKK